MEQGNILNEFDLFYEQESITKDVSGSQLDLAACAASQLVAYESRENSIFGSDMLKLNADDPFHDDWPYWS